MGEFDYSRSANPTRAALERAIAVLKAQGAEVVDIKELGGDDKGVKLFAGWRVNNNPTFGVTPAMVKATPFTATWRPMASACRGLTLRPKDQGKESLTTSTDVPSPNF